MYVDYAICIDQRKLVALCLQSCLRSSAPLKLLAALVQLLLSFCFLPKEGRYVLDNEAICVLVVLVVN